MTNSNIVDLMAMTKVIKPFLEDELNKNKALNKLAQFLLDRKELHLLSASDLREIFHAFYATPNDELFYMLEPYILRSLS